MKNLKQLWFAIATTLAPVFKQYLGSVATVIGELIGGIVMLFVGLFMIDAVYNAIGINNTSTFLGVSNWLVTWTGTIFTILGLVITVIALGTAFRSIMGFTKGG